MAPEDLMSLLHAQPYAPLRIVTTAGVNYTITHPDLAMVGINSVTIGTPHPENPKMYFGIHVVSFYHIVRVEVLTPAAPV